MSAPTREEIAAAFKRIEAEHGGTFLSDTKEVLQLVSEEMNMPYQDVRSAMLDTWTMPA